MALSRSVARFVVLAGLVLGACAGGDDMKQTVWDFSTPLTPIDLGSKVKDFRELEGETDLKVVFPSGRIVEGVWDRGARASGLGVSDAEPQPVDWVILFEASATDIDELRASAARFLDVWGPASGAEGTIEDFIEQTAVLNEREGTPIGQTYRVGRNVMAFDGEEQDGITPTWNPRFTGDIVTIQVSLKFEPASN